MENEDISILKEWISYYNNLLYLFNIGDHLEVYNQLRKLKESYQNELNKYQVELNNLTKDFLKIQIDSALDLGNKELFLKTTEEYNKLVYVK